MIWRERDSKRIVVVTKGTFARKDATGHHFLSAHWTVVSSCLGTNKMNTFHFHHCPLYFPQVYLISFRFSSNRVILILCIVISLLSVETISCSTLSIPSSAIESQELPGNPLKRSQSDHYSSFSVFTPSDLVS